MHFLESKLKRCIKKQSEEEQVTPGAVGESGTTLCRRKLGKKARMGAKK